MNKLLIVSDSHGSKDVLQQIEKLHKDEVDLMIHCGDSELEETDAAIANFRSVKGNCDLFGDFPEEETHEFHDLTIFVTHGHRYSVKSTIGHLFYKAKEVGADIVCFGHSHLLGVEMIEDVLFLNPGSIRLPRGRKEKTYIILEVDKDHATVYVHELDNGELTHLRQEFSLPKKQ